MNYSKSNDETCSEEGEPPPAISRLPLRDDLISNSSFFSLYRFSRGYKDNQEKNEVIKDIGIKYFEGMYNQESYEPGVLKSDTSDDEKSEDFDLDLEQEFLVLVNSINNSKNDFLEKILRNNELINQNLESLTLAT